MMNKKDIKLAILGLGYVGLPLAVAFGHKRPVLGFDISERRIADLKKSHDKTMEMSEEEIESSEFLQFSSHIEDLEDKNCYIITVPTPIDFNKEPDLEAIKAATKTVGSFLNSGNVVIYESTVYPGCTEEVCVPILEELSGLEFNKDFFCGYSPERINPGDKTHRLTNIVKVTSGSTNEAAKLIDALYQEVIEAGTYQAESIKVAEAAKVIENTQRDLNIALINELSIIFNKLDIDTEDVLNAAETKWNFLPFRPGLVGGHCIGVDPYYLAHKGAVIGHKPEVVLSGRKVNDEMGVYVAQQLVNEMKRREMNIIDSSTLILGLTFKENCTDIRNTKVIDVYRELLRLGLKCDVYDPWVNKQEVLEEYEINICEEEDLKKYDGIIFAVAHKEFLAFSKEKLNKISKETSVIYDLKNILPKSFGAMRL